MNLQCMTVCREAANAFRYIRTTGPQTKSRGGRGVFGCRAPNQSPGRKLGASMLRPITRDSLSRMIHLVRRLPACRLYDPISVLSMISDSRLPRDGRPSVDGGPIRAVIIVCSQCMSCLSRDAGSSDKSHNKCDPRFHRHHLSLAVSSIDPISRPRAPVNRARGSIMQRTSY